MSGLGVLPFGGHRTGCYALLSVFGLNIQMSPLLVCVGTVLQAWSVVVKVVLNLAAEKCGKMRGVSEAWNKRDLASTCKKLRLSA